MSQIKKIYNDEDHSLALKSLRALMAAKPDPDSDDGQQMVILAKLIEAYEDKRFPIDLPNAIEAIKFRMDQLDMQPSDLVPYLGSTSRVSEILTGKRKLTMSMIRKLESGLKIPAKVLIRQPADNQSDIASRFDKKVLNIMDKRGYFATQLPSKSLTEKIKLFFSGDTFLKEAPHSLRQSNHRIDPRESSDRLRAWTRHVGTLAAQAKTAEYKPKSINIDFMRKLAKLSVKVDGPLRVKDALAEVGVIFIVEKHLPQTYIDGAVLATKDDQPVVCLTLRYDRLDNFWFTLMHELAHVALHFDAGDHTIFDEFEAVKVADRNKKEQAADELASEALIPASQWEISPLRVLPSPLAAQSLAKDLKIDVSLVIGKFRYETKEWHRFSGFVKSKPVRDLFFPEDNVGERES